MNVGEVNVSSIKTAVEACCRGDHECGSCQGRQCLVGFAKLVSEYAGSKKVLSIPGGLKMVPTGDFKVYDADDMAIALAVINNECKNCMDNHDDDCIINIIRSTLEVALLGQHVDFSGNPLSYVMELVKINEENGNKVMQAYRSLKKA